MKRLVNYALVAIGLLFVAIVAGVFSGARAVAQTAIKAALVKNVDERGRVPWQVTQTTGSCVTQECAIAFPPVPAGKRLVIEYVSGAITNAGDTGHPGKPIVRLYTYPTNFEFAANLPVSQALLTSSSAWAVSAPVLAYVEERLLPFVIITNEAPLSPTGTFTITAT
jgi:hypothetical protein